MTDDPYMLNGISIQYVLLYRRPAFTVFLQGNSCDSEFTNHLLSYVSGNMPLPFLKMKGYGIFSLCRLPALGFYFILANLALGTHIYATIVLQVG
jgi:hypothetical protein